MQTRDMTIATGAKLGLFVLEHSPEGVGPGRVDLCVARHFGLAARQPRRHVAVLRKIHDAGCYECADGGGEGMVGDGDGVGGGPLLSRQIAVQPAHALHELLQSLGVQLLPAEYERVLRARRERGRDYYEVDISAKS